MEVSDLTKIYKIHQQAQRLIDLLGGIDCDMNARERKPFITLQNGLLRARFSAGNILIMNRCFLTPQSQWEALDRRSYDEKEALYTKSGGEIVYRYRYFFPHGTIIADGVEIDGRECAEVCSAYWYDIDGNEVKLQ